MKLLTELKRRNVFKVAVAYLVTAWLIAQVTDVFLNNFGAPEWVVRTVLFLLVIGFPCALLLAWAYELTPDGPRRQYDVDAADPGKPESSVNLNRVILVVLLLAIVILAGERLYVAGESNSTVDPKTIAVLPFKDLSETQDQQWFADGLAEEIYNSLTKTPDISVSSRTSTFRSFDQGLGIEETAERLGVAHILEGSVRRSGDRVRVIAQLVRAADGFHVWSEDYDRDLADVIAIQEDLAVQIARALQTTMDPDALTEMLRVGTRSVEAYDLFLRGRVAMAEAYNQRDAEYFGRAHRYFEQARTIDPGFGEAHMAAAQFWYVQISPIRLFSDLSDVSLAEAKREFDLRISAAIANAATATDQKLYRATAYLTDLRVSESIDLFKAYLLDRPQHLTPNFALMDAAHMVGDTDTMMAIAGVWYEQGKRDEQAAGEFLSTSYDFWDAGDAADYARWAVEQYPNAQSVRYAAHRALLWTGLVEEAAAIQPVWAGTGDVPEWVSLFRMRQACAEGRRSDAEAHYADMVATRVASPVARFLGSLMLRRDNEAYAAVGEIASEEVPYSLALLLNYEQFDADRFPILRERLEATGSSARVAKPAPYRCP